MYSQTCTTCAYSEREMRLILGELGRLNNALQETTVFAEIAKIMRSVERARADEAALMRLQAAHMVYAHGGDDE